jgi:autotransporter-associated beta strand protein
MQKLNFGNQTGYVHVVRRTENTESSFTFTSKVMGTGGLVKSGNGNLELTGDNLFSGDVFINSGKIIVKNDSSLGNAANIVHILSSQTSSGLEFNSSLSQTQYAPNTLVLGREIRMGPSGGAISVRNSTDTLVINRGISGNGPLFKRGEGTLVLNGINTYEKETTIHEGVLKIASDSALGATEGFIRFSGFGTGTLEPATNLVSSRNVLGDQTMRIFTNRNNLTLSGVLASRSGQGLTKLGEGNLTLTNTSTFSGATIIGLSDGSVVSSELSSAQTGGRLILSGANGSIAMSRTITINQGSTLCLDNSEIVNPYRVGQVGMLMNSGSFEIVGNSADDVDTVIGDLNSQSFANTITLSQTSGTGNTRNALTISSYSNPTSNQLTFVRGTRLGDATGNRSAVLFNSVPTTTVAGILPSFVGSDSANGDPVEFLRLGATAAGQTSLEIFTNYFADNPNAGAGSVCDVTANRALNAESTIGAMRVSTGNLDLAGNSLFIHSGSLISVGNREFFNTGSTSTVTFGGTTQGGGSNPGIGRITNTGTLKIGPNVVISAQRVLKFGRGDLVLNQAVSSNAQVWTVAQGALQYGVPGALPTNALVELAPDATLDLNSHHTTLRNVTGYGNLQIGSGSLTLTDGQGTFAGSISGVGSMKIRGSSNYVLSGNNSSYAGDWMVEGGTLTIGSGLALGSGAVYAGADGVASNCTIRLAVSPNAAVSNDVHIRPQAALVIRPNPLTNGTYSGNFFVEHTGRLHFAGGSQGVWSLNGNISGKGDVTIAGGQVNLWGDNRGLSGNVNALATTIGVGSNNAFGTGVLTLDSAHLRADNGARNLDNPIVFMGHSSLFGDNDLTLNGDVSAMGLSH